MILFQRMYVDEVKGIEFDRAFGYRSHFKPFGTYPYRQQCPPYRLVASTARRYGGSHARVNGNSICRQWHNVSERKSIAYTRALPELVLVTGEE